MTEDVLVTGAASQVGYFLIPRLVAAGMRVIAVSRRPEAAATAAFGLNWPGAGAARWVQADLSNEDPSRWVGHCRAWIHLGPLALVPPALSGMSTHGLTRVIAFGSTSRFTKARSAQAGEQRLVASLIAGEDALKQACSLQGIDWNLFRPTLIHGCGLDRNVMVIAGAIRRFGVFPLVGRGDGRRQPVHADDLAQACVTALGQPRGCSGAYELSGGEVLTYQEMVARIFIALGRMPRFVRVPVAAIGSALWCLSRLPRYRDFNAEMARRMTQDMVFPHAAAERDLGYAPRGFHPVVVPPA